MGGQLLTHTMNGSMEYLMMWMWKMWFGPLQKTGLPKEKMMICGDRLYTDIKTGVDFGILSACVLSGESTLEDIEKSDVKPDLVFDRLSDMIEYI